MALVSPGVQVTVIDESQCIPSAVNTVPYFLIATAQNKVSSDGITVAAGTTAANANKLQAFGWYLFRTKPTDWTPATKILIALVLSVPEHNSSPKTRLRLSASLKIVLNSDISTANVDKPLNKLSLPNIRVNILVYGLYTKLLHGTYNLA